MSDASAIITITPDKFDASKLSMTQARTMRGKVARAFGRVLYDGKEFRMQVKSQCSRGTAFYDNDKVNEFTGKKGAYVLLEDVTKVPAAADKNVKVSGSLRGARNAVHNPTTATPQEKYELSVVRMIQAIESFVWENGGMQGVSAANRNFAAGMFEDRKPWINSILVGDPVEGPMYYADAKTGEQRVCSLSINYSLYLQETRGKNNEARVDKASCSTITGWEYHPETGARVKPVAVPGTFFRDYKPGATCYDVFELGQPAITTNKLTVGARMKDSFVDTSTCYSQASRTPEEALANMVADW